jgi:hypothetical protein
MRFCLIKNFVFCVKDEISVAAGLGHTNRLSRRRRSVVAAAEQHGGSAERSSSGRGEHWMRSGAL